MTIKLFVQAITKYILGIVLVGLLIFLPAGSLSYFNGWLLMGLLFIPMFFAGIVLMVKNPVLLKKRLNAKEKLSEQELVIKLSKLMFVAGFVIAGLGYRLQWHMLNTGFSVLASITFLASYTLYAEVLKENTYLSRTIEIQENQKLIDTGLYSIVRHPMYSATLIMFLSMPIILGSVYAFIIFCAYPFIIAKRIRSEEQFLEKELPGYTEYKKKVKYRLIPYIW